MTSTAYVSFGAVAVPSAESLSDAFDGTSIDTGKWTTFSYGTGSTLAEGGGELTVTTTSTSGWAGIWSNSTYAFTETAVILELPAAGNAAVTGSVTQAGLRLQTLQAQPEDSPAIKMEVSEGTLYLGYQTTDISPDSDVNVASLPFDAVGHKWWRLRETDGVTYWDTSPDGATWTNQASIADPVPVSALYITIWGDTYSDGATGSAIGFANFSEGPGGTAVITVSYVVLGSGGGIDYGPATTVAAFNYGDTGEAIREAAVSAVQFAAGDPALEAEFL